MLAGFGAAIEIEVGEGEQVAAAGGWRRVIALSSHVADCRQGAPRVPDRPQRAQVIDHRERIRCRARVCRVTAETAQALLGVVVQLDHRIASRRVIRFIELGVAIAVLAQAAVTVDEQGLQVADPDQLAAGTVAAAEVVAGLVDGARAGA